MVQVQNLYNESSQQLATLNQAIRTSIGATAAGWAGQDAASFLGSWESEFYPPLLNAINALQGVHQTLSREVSQQATASTT
jgi:uncharacterized protein YukE